MVALSIVHRYQRGDTAAFYKFEAHALLDTTDRKELKAALTHFIEQIMIEGQDVTIEYLLKKPATANLSVNGDPGEHWVLH